MKQRLPHYGRVHYKHTSIRMMPALYPWPKCLAQMNVMLSVCVDSISKRCKLVSFFGLAQSEFL